MWRWVRRVGAIVLVLMTIIADPAGAASLPGLLTGLSIAKPLVVRPSEVIYTGDSSGVLGGFDGNGRAGHFGHLRWSSWTQSRALGSGAVWLDDCTPSCAQGRFAAYRVTIRASARTGGHFTRLTLFYRYHGKQIVDSRKIVQHGRYYTYQ